MQVQQLHDGKFSDQSRSKSTVEKEKLVSDPACTDNLLTKDAVKQMDLVDGMDKTGGDLPWRSSRFRHRSFSVRMLIKLTHARWLADNGLILIHTVILSIVSFILLRSNCRRLLTDSGAFKHDSSLGLHLASTDSAGKGLNE